MQGGRQRRSAGIPVDEDDLPEPVLPRLDLPCSLLVSGVGGTLGTVVGLGGAKVVSLVTPLAATVRPLTVLFGVLFAALVGLVFGIWPAARAANLDPVEALRDE